MCRKPLLYIRCRLLLLPLCDHSLRVVFCMFVCLSVCPPPPLSLSVSLSLCRSRPGSPPLSLSLPESQSQEHTTTNHRDWTGWHHKHVPHERLVYVCTYESNRSSTASSHYKQHRR